MAHFMGSELAPQLLLVKRKPISLRREVMKQFTHSIVALSGFLAITLAITGVDHSPALAADTGNQLMKGYTHWYEKAAESIAPVKGFTAKDASLVLKAGSYLYLEGDSTLHKYQMHANALEGSASVPQGDLLKALKAGKVDGMTLVIPLKDFKSRESGLDDNAYKALKSKENPEIRFALKSETLKAGATAGSFVMTAKGSLTVAGATAPITLKADVTVKDGKVELKGVQKLKMSDFKVTPPSISLLVTAITCTDDIEIHYDVIFGKP
jgi:hypothetical protein